MIILVVICEICIKNISKIKIVFQRNIYVHLSIPNWRIFMQEYIPRHIFHKEKKKNDKTYNHGEFGCLL